MILCNLNGGGIVGNCSGGIIEYCFNQNTVTNQDPNHPELNSHRNRLGGICGAAADLFLCGCYNVGDVTGHTSWDNTPLLSPTGGLVGLLIDDGSYIKSNPYTTKYLNIDVTYFDLGSIHNTICYNYNAGNIKGHYSGAGEGSIFDIWDKIKQWLGSSSKDDISEDVLRSRLWYNGAIVGYVAVNIDLDLSKSFASTTNFVFNYYLQGSSESGRWEKWSK